MGLRLDSLSCNQPLRLRGNTTHIKTHKKGAKEHEKVQEVELFTVTEGQSGK